MSQKADIVLSAEETDKKATHPVNDYYSSITISTSFISNQVEITSEYSEKVKKWRHSFGDNNLSEERYFSSLLKLLFAGQYKMYILCIYLWFVYLTNNF